MTAPSAWGRSIRLMPGGRPAVWRSPRADLASALALGRPAEVLPDRMAALHGLCAAGHRLAATLAVRAARGEPADPTPEERRQLRAAVLREHLLHLGQAAPRMLDPGADGLDPADAPWPGRHSALAPRQAAQGVEGDLTDLTDWLHARWLHQPAGALAQAIGADPVAATLAWARRTDTPCARWWRRVLPAALSVPTPWRPLHAGALPELPDHVVPDTGPWTRVADPSLPEAHNAGMRLIARLLDLLRLAGPQGAGRLHAAAHAPAPGLGRAWVEVGRGLLTYEVRLDGADVAALRVVAPTDWNVHPAGVLAEALSRARTADEARLLAVAYDPCEPCEVMLPEAAHA